MNFFCFVPCLQSVWIAVVLGFVSCSSLCLIKMINIDQLTYDVIYLHSDRPLLINAGQKQYKESVQKYKNPLLNSMQNWFCFNFEILCSL